MFGRKKEHANRSQTDPWLEVSHTFFDADNDRFVFVRGARHPNGDGLPLIQVDFLDDSRRSLSGARDGYGKNITEVEAQQLIETFPERAADQTFHNLVLEVINKSIQT